MCLCIFFGNSNMQAYLPICLWRTAIYFKSLFLIIIMIIKVFYKQKSIKHNLRSTFSSCSVLTLKSIHWKKNPSKDIGWENSQIHCAGYKYYSAQLRGELKLTSYKKLLLHCICEAAWENSSEVTGINKILKNSQQNWLN